MRTQLMVGVMMPNAVMLTAVTVRWWLRHKYLFLNLTAPVVSGYLPVKTALCPTCGIEEDLTHILFDYSNHAQLTHM